MIHSIKDFIEGIFQLLVMILVMGAILRLFLKHTLIGRTMLEIFKGIKYLVKCSWKMGVYTCKTSYKYSKSFYKFSEEFYKKTSEKYNKSKENKQKQEKKVVNGNAINECNMKNIIDFQKVKSNKK